MTTSHARAPINAPHHCDPDPRPRKRADAPIRQPPWAYPRSYPRSAASFARSCVALIRRIVPERVRITSDSVLAPPALG